MSALKPDTLPEGAPFAIGAAIVHALRSDPALAGVTVLDNPKRASDLQAGARIVFFEDQADKLIEQPGDLNPMPVFSFLGSADQHPAQRP